MDNKLRIKIPGGSLANQFKLQILNPIEKNK